MAEAIVALALGSNLFGGRRSSCSKFFYFQVFAVGLGVGTIFALPLNERITLMITGGRIAAYRAVLLWFQTR